VSFCIPAEQVGLLEPEAGKSDPSRDTRLPVRIAEEIFTPTSVRVRLEVRNESGTAASAASSASSTAPIRIESEVSRALYQKMKLAEQKDWLAELPAAAIHVFDDSSEPRA
jgi:hypothetical protein